MNTFLWGFNGESGEQIVSKLSNDQQFEIMVWISNSKKCTHNIFDFFNVRDNIFVTKEHDVLLYKSCYDQGLNTFINMFSRHFQSHEFTYHDFIDAFNIIYQKLFSLITEKRIKLIIYSNIPHEGPDYISYLIAKELKINTLMFYQSPVGKRFFITQDLSDFGTFENTKQIENAEIVKIDRNHKGQYFYMQNVKVLENSAIPKKWNYYLNLLLKKRYWDLTITMNKHLRYRKFVYSSYRLSHKISMDAVKFVYFPLALQPELTTSAIGGIYNDQLLAIERLSQILPEDWKIIVKENPKQTDFQRGEWFFKRLSHIKNTILIDPRTNSNMLIEKSQFVSVITGTAGWEAIKGGKKALVFGLPWYLSLPGVIKYSEETTLSKIENYTFTHSDLETAFSNLLSKSGKGIIDQAYIKDDPNFDSNLNADSVIKCLKRNLNINNNKYVK